MVHSAGPKPQIDQGHHDSMEGLGGLWADWSWQRAMEFLASVMNARRRSVDGVCSGGARIRTNFWHTDLLDAGVTRRAKLYFRTSMALSGVLVQVFDNVTRNHNSVA